MIRILALVEGQTEETFVREILAPELSTSHRFISAFLIGRPGHRGGIRRYSAVKADLLRLIRSDPTAFFTTMFDYYGLPSDFPGHHEASRATSPANKAGAIEKALLADVAATLGDTWMPKHFVPYVQMHEFESLLFADPVAFARGVNQPSLAAQLQAICRQFPDPEHIDHGRATHPSKRITNLLPRYQKPLYGALGALEITLPSMIAACPHFAHWVTTLRSLG